MSTQTLQGIGASLGIAIGPVLHYEIRQLVVERRQVEDVNAERARLATALTQAQQEISALAARAAKNAGSSEAAIFEAHEMILSDPELLEQVHASIETQHANAEYAWQEGTQQYAEALRSIGDEYLAGRAADIEDVAQRVLCILQGTETQSIKLTQPVVIVASDLTPSATIQLDKRMVLAFCTASGGPTSHVAILSKALGIPAIVGLGASLDQLHNDTQVIVDGSIGTIQVNPDAATIAHYQQQAQSLSQKQQQAFRATHEPATTLDGVQVEVVANIGSPEEATTALEHGAEGVGLLRTEFLFLDRTAAPDEEEQTAVYRSVLQTMGQRPVVVRTLDIGGDKPAPYLAMPTEMNPFLGIRGLRLSLAQPEIFQVQLRALLRAGAGHNLKIMFPMVATREEILAARDALAQAQTTLAAHHISYAHQYEIGMMVEIPAAALTADTLAEVVDFFSIGTNDLAQYTLAADRTNADVTTLADAFHPAVLRLIRMVIEAAHTHNRWVGLCGELASDPLIVPVLLGLGLDEFSMTARAIPLAKQTIRRYSKSEAREIAQHALSLGTAAAVRAYLQSVAK